MSMPVSVLYLCLCPGMCGFAGSICYVSTHFRYILTILVLIRNTFLLATASSSNTVLFDKAAKKQIDKQGNFG